MSERPRDFLVFLEDMLLAISRIEKYVGDMSLEDFSRNQMAVDAVVRNFEIIGEAARSLPEDIRLRHAQVAWREAVGFRNILIHQYFGVDTEVLWETVQADLPVLRASLEGVYEAEKDDRSREAAPNPPFGDPHPHPPFGKGGQGGLKHDD